MDSDKFLNLLAGECADFHIVAKAVLGAPSLVNVLNEQDVTALMFATCNNPEGVIELLLDRGADLHFTDNEGATALHWAARGGEVEAVRTLLAHGADWTAKDIFGKTPAQMTKDEKVLAEINACAAGNMPPRFTNSLTREQTVTALELSIAAAEGDGAALRRILQDEPQSARWQEPYTRGDALISAAYHKALPEEDLCHLLACGADPLLTDRWGKTALDYAADNIKGVDYRETLIAAQNEARAAHAIQQALTSGVSATFRVGKPLTFKR